MSPDRSTHDRRVDAEDFRDAAGRFFPDGYRLLEASGASPGYSGSAFARVEAAGRAWLLRRWPLDLAEERLRFVHRTLTESRSRGFSGVPGLACTPRGETAIRVADGLYDAQEFYGGETLSAHGPRPDAVPNVASCMPPERLAALAEALARFHLSTSGLPLEPGHRASPLVQRLQDLEVETMERHEPLLRGVQTLRTGDERKTALRWMELMPRALGAALGGVAALPLRGTSEVLCHADLWPEHVFFEGDSFSGFADFESLAFASPALDLAQLVGHFGGWGAARTVLRSYRAVAPLGEGDEASLAPEAVADLAAEGLWALEELYGGSSRASVAQEAAHRLNLGLLLGPLVEATGACERPR